MRRFAIIVLACASAAAGKPEPGKAPSAKPLVVGIGQPNGEEAARRAQALVEPWLGKALGRPVTVKVMNGYDELSAALAAGGVDVGWMTPVAFADARAKSAEVKAVVKAKRNGALFYRTAFIVKKDAAARTLGDLRGKKVAWVSPNSASGYIFARAMIAGAGHDPDAFFGGEAWMGTHPAVCKAVRDGAADVGATLADPPAPGREGMQADGCVDSPPLTDFRVIAASEPIPNDVIATRAGFDAKLAAALRDAFDGLAKGDEGKKVLTEAFRVEGWVPAAEKDLATLLRVAAAGRPAKVPAPATAKAADAGTIGPATAPAAPPAASDGGAAAVDAGATTSASADAGSRGGDR